MARKPNTTPDERTQLASFALGWNQKLRVPTSLVTELLTILDQCTVVQEHYMGGNAYCYVDDGPMSVQTTTHLPSRVTYAANAEEAKQFVEYHNATRKLMNDPAPGPICTIEEFRATLGKEE